MNPKRPSFSKIRTIISKEIKKLYMDKITSSNAKNVFGFVPPGHYYSPIPSFEEIQEREDDIFNRNKRSLPAIDLNEKQQLILFEQLARYYPKLPYHNRDDTRYKFDNDFFCYCDAIVLYNMILHLKPKRIIEIGSGYSSCISLDANEISFSNSIDLYFIEPYPNRLISLCKETDNINLISRKLQEIDVEFFDLLEENDILFIDSTHVSKVGSDVNYIIFDILPRLRKGVYIHFHDIFYPFEYPIEWIKEGRFWNEDYILRAFLEYNETFKIVFFNSFLCSFHEELFQEQMPLCLQNSGGSIWLKKVQ